MATLKKRRKVNSGISDESANFEYNNYSREEYVTEKPNHRLSDALSSKFSDDGTITFFW